MSSSFVVVVIVGGLVFAIAVATVSGWRPPMAGTKPATAWRPAELGPDRAGGATAVRRWAPPDFDPDAADDGPSEPSEPIRRARSTVLLLGSLVVLGAAAAALLGITALVVVQVMDRALGP